MTLEALAAAGVSVAAVVLNQTTPPNSRTEKEQERSTIELLRCGVSVPVLGPLPYFPRALDQWETAVERAAADPAIVALADLVAPTVPSGG